MSKSPGYFSCIACPQNAFCLGGDSISPVAGFWRSSNVSTLILACPVKEACLGAAVKENITDKDSFIKGECHEGHRGALCNDCTDGRAKLRSNSLCKPCGSQPLIWIKLFLSALFMITYVAIQANVFSRIERKEPNAAVCIKLLLNHFQTAGIISLLELGWTLDFSFYLTYLEYISYITEDYLEIDCFVL
jgi:hypothetical protein